jgi:hypothetical protein
MRDGCYVLLASRVTELGDRVGARPYRGDVPFPKPIRVDVDFWLVMRTDAVLPKAGIQRLRDQGGDERFLVIKWATDPTKRVLMGIHPTLEQANDMVLFDNVDRGPKGPPNGR